MDVSQIVATPSG